MYKQIDKIVDKIVKLSPSNTKQLKHYKTKLSGVLDKSVAAAITNLNKQVSTIIKTLDTGPTVDINRLIDNINALNGLGLTSSNNDDNIPHIKGEYSCDAAIIVTSRVDPAIPLTLKSGSRLILTTRTLDLSNFNTDELHEILSVLDVLAPDERYDTLRTILTEEISKRG